MDEKPDSRNWILPGVENALVSVRNSVAGVNSRPASPAAGISTDISPVARWQGECSLLGMPTWVTKVLRGYWLPEACLKRCSTELLTSACSEGVEAARPGSRVNGGRLFGRPGLSAGCGLILTSPLSLSGSTPMLALIAPTWWPPSAGVSDFQPNYMANQPLA